MGSIVLLDDLTINKIAAGEVIERPASVVKEMVENSIDAGATQINIEIQNGGVSKIRISDNGKGIEPDDMLIAFERHATSKIRQADDLEYIRTMGFRGEALASIAAIARVEMVSRTMRNDAGYKVVVEGGNIISEEMIGATVGTTITVEKLFFNTPVRYKFLKKDYTEAGYIEDAVKRIALVNPDLAIKLVNNGKTIIQTNGNGKIEDVIYGIYGKEIVEGLLPIEYKYENIFVKGVIGKPEIARSNRSNQMFFVNNRYVKDKTLSAAVEQAMKGMLPIGKFPFLVMNIQLDPQKVDVNVHPAKVEVRFVDESEVFKAVMYAIKESLLAGSLISNVSKEKNVDEIYQRHYETQLKMQNLKEEIKNHEWKKKEDMVENIQEEIKAEQPKKIAKNIVDLFKKVSKEKEAEEKFKRETDNIIGDIFREKEENRIREDDEARGNEINRNNLEYNEIYTNESSYNVNSYNENNNIDDENSENNKNPNDIFNNNVYELTTDEINVLQQTDEVKQLQEDSFDYVAEDLYRFEELKKLQTEVLKDIEKMPVLIDEKEENEIEEIRDRIFSKESEENSLNSAKTEDISAKDMESTQVNNIPLEQQVVNEPQNFEDMYEKTFGTVPASVKRQEVKFDNLQYVETENLTMFTKNDKYKGYKYIGTVFSTYVLLEIEDELYMLDQHAAHERIMYEKIKENYYSSDKDCQMMLLPDVINLTNKEICILRENKEVFEKAGFVVEEFGDKTVKLMGVPSLCMDMDTKALFLDILDEIDTVARTERQEIEEKFIATVACKSAVKANMHLEFEEVTMLLDTLLQLPNPFTCPHGRPTAIKMTKTDIEKKFSRR